MHELPPFGTAPIRCGRTRCSWRGFESDLQEMHGDVGSKILSCSVCPTCGCGSYSLMTAGEIQAWERKQRAQAMENGCKRTESDAQAQQKGQTP